MYNHINANLSYNGKQNSFIQTHTNLYNIQYTYYIMVSGCPSI